METRVGGWEKKDDELKKKRKKKGELETNEETSSGKGNGVVELGWKIRELEDSKKRTNVPRSDLPRDYCQEEEDRKTDLARSCEQVDDLESAPIVLRSGSSEERP